MSKKIRKKSSKSDSSVTVRAATVAHTEQAREAGPSPSPAATTKTKPRPAPPASQGAGLAEGSPAPPFNLPREDGALVSLADFAGGKLVIFFYPRAGTPGCTIEAMDFTRLATDFAVSGTAVIGVSADPVKAQLSFRNKHQLSIALISDEKHQMLEAYGVWGEKSMYGKTFMGVLRTTVLVDGAGRIARIWRRVKVEGHADEVLAAAREL
ncbi:alkyl hydroperoxide reductase/ Thiol specific antioxidant/ Mal allergen [Nitrobacter winogradskyi Nb-255]|uniref:thioredoxin-dependent peroxiredoxin n=1 Tax=Nitrobacter winogradskyi (strain ATCC 25391 / DSM 10237 / CIP 104748 / NCIMB 11846 / Nb-255) TaxID=323098 RepID=Q3SS10_NITWN|nr:peroxiredoxin [Nitrobacter winogradskyi]ABA04931.1 alkyl hydroperoxide reductase/ Thiol specific antioxidant/ Mal allergen [Nitrobacter winogradskyi Nb-255]